MIKRLFLVLGQRIWGAFLLFFFVGVTGVAASSDLAESRAAALFKQAEMYLAAGNPSRAIDKFSAVVKAYRTTDFAARSQLRIAEIYDANGKLTAAFNAYQGYIDAFPKTENFEKTIEAQLGIARRIVLQWELESKYGREPAKGLPSRSELDNMMETLRDNARYSSLAPEILYETAVVMQQNRRNVTARKLLADFIDKYPKHQLADDASFQYAYIDFRKVMDGDWRSKMRAEFAMRDFIQTHPDSEKVPQADRCIRLIGKKEAERLVNLARQYRAFGNERSASLYLQKAMEEHPEETLEVDGAKALMNSLLKDRDAGS
ncbi:MAG: tetratricopeptide repeat protein [Verrucomicrobiota bacterium]